MKKGYIIFRFVNFCILMDERGKEQLSIQDGLTGRLKTSYITNTLSAYVICFRQRLDSR
jgi:hypothetical protein